MKKLILALVALACAFAISSCCDQSHCPGNMRCGPRGERGTGPNGEGDQRSSRKPPRWYQSHEEYQQTEDVPYRFDRRNQPMPDAWRSTRPSGCSEDPPQDCQENQTRPHRRW